MPAQLTETRFQIHPLASWIFSAVTSALTLVYLISVAARKNTIDANEIMVPLLIVPALIACAIWLGARPSYSVAINRAANKLSMAQTWPMKKILHDIQLSDVTSVAVQTIEGSDSDAYRTVIVTKSGGNIPVSTELISKNTAERLAQNLRTELAR